MSWKRYRPQIEQIEKLNPGEIYHELWEGLPAVSFKPVKCEQGIGRRHESNKAYIWVAPTQEENAELYWACLHAPGSSVGASKVYKELHAFMVDATNETLDVLMERIHIANVSERDKDIRAMMDELETRKTNSEKAYESEQQRIKKEYQQEQRDIKKELSNLARKIGAKIGYSWKEE